MFDKIFEVIQAVWEWFIFWVIIDEYEMGVILQFGKFRRIVGPGWRLMCPFGIDVCKYETVVRQTSYLDPQSLTTKDGTSVTLAGIITYKIIDIRKFLLEIDEGETDMTNMIYGIIDDCVEDTNWNKVRCKEFNRRVLRYSQKECNTYCGVNVIAVKWSDKATARNIRLWND